MLSPRPDQHISAARRAIPKSRCCLRSKDRDFSEDRNGQTTENQRRELEAVAARSGWEVVDIFEDAGISGAKGRDKRPGFDRLLKDATARKVNMVAAWSVDRLGRSL